MTLEIREGDRKAAFDAAAAIVLFCRPVGEDPLTTGRHFYRSWLEIDRAGFAACPISALADHPGFNDRLRKLGRIGAELRLVNVFRVGRPAKPLKPRHFRLPVEQLIILEHDPEKWKPVFRKDHAQTKR
ncbi:hypothetical protein [Bradyrhizobium sp. USDA 4454]